MNWHLSKLFQCTNCHLSFWLFSEVKIFKSYFVVTLCVIHCKPFLNNDFNINILVSLVVYLNRQVHSYVPRVQSYLFIVLDYRYAAQKAKIHLIPVIWVVNDQSKVCFLILLFFISYLNVSDPYPYIQNIFLYKSTMKITVIVSVSSDLFVSVINLKFQ